MASTIGKLLPMRLSQSVMNIYVTMKMVELLAELVLMGVDIRLALVEIMLLRLWKTLVWVGFLGATRIADMNYFFT